MKLLLVICSLVTIVWAQEPSLSCHYWNWSGGYFCQLEINNPDGYNNFTEIGGNHLEGFSNADVNEIRRAHTSSTANIPRIICDTFPNIQFFSLINYGITGIDDSAFSGCSSITDLVLHSNRIDSISENAFVNLGQLVLLNLRSNPQLVEIDDNVFRGLESLRDLDLANCGISELNSNVFQGLTNLNRLQLDFNDIEDVPEGAFASIHNLRYLHMWNNRLRTLRRDSFGTLTELRTLNLQGNFVNALDRAIIDDTVNLQSLFFDGNRCASNSFVEFSSRRAEYLRMLESCFLNMGNIVGNIEKSLLK